MHSENVKRPIYPLIAVLLSVATLFYGLLTAKLQDMHWFYVGIFLLYIVTGYYRAALASLPVAAFMIALFAGITYATSGQNIQNTLAAVNRSLAISFSIIPLLSISNTLFIRNLQQIKCPKIIVLGMMISVNFFPLFAKEIRQIRDAMRTRGATSWLNPKVIYRAFLIPLVVRIVNISDTLSISVETRGFTVDKSEVTIYNPIKLKLWDIFIVLLFIVIAVLVVVL